MQTPEQTARKQPNFEPHTLETRERAFQVWLKLQHLQKTAMEIGVPLGTLANWSKRGQWKIRRDAMRRKDNKPRGDAGENTSSVLDASVALVPTAEFEKMSFEERQAFYRNHASIQALRAIQSIELLPTAALVGAAGDIVKADQFARKALDLEKSVSAVVVNVAYLAQPTAVRDPDSQEVIEGEIVPEIDSVETAVPTLALV